MKINNFLERPYQFTGLASLVFFLNETINHFSNFLEARECFLQFHTLCLINNAYVLVLETFVDGQQTKGEVWLPTPPLFRRNTNGKINKFARPCINVVPLI